MSGGRRPIVNASGLWKDRVQRQMTTPITSNNPLPETAAAERLGPDDRKLALDKVSDHHALCAAEQIGRYEGSQRGDKYQNRSGPDSGATQRDQHTKEGFQR